MVTEAGLVIFCWGDDTNNPDTIKYLKELGMHAVIYDKINQFSPKAPMKEESTFLLEARESQKELIVLTASSLEQVYQEEGQGPKVMKSDFIDEGKARENMMTLSTATSLSSLHSGISRNSNTMCAAAAENHPHRP